jgi:YD repeat-containing protein
MPVWWVSEPHLNIRFSDEPLTYRPAVGPVVSFKLGYRQRGAAQVPANVWPQVPSVGNGWTCSFISYLVHNPAWSYGAYAAAGGITNGAGEVIVGLDYGFMRSTGLGMGAQNRWENLPHARDGSILSTASGGTGYVVLYADGSVDVYTNAFNVSGYFHGGCKLYFLSERRDPHGLSLTFHYSSDGVGVKLTQVTDAMGGTTSLQYTNTSFSNHVTAVVAPSGHRTDLVYNEYGSLVSITDSAGIESTFGYGANWIGLTTPYGSTSFVFGEVHRQRTSCSRVPVMSGNRSG